MSLKSLTPLQKRRAVWRLAGDIRGEGAAILLRLWSALGWPEQAQNNPGLPYGVCYHNTYLR